MAYIPDLDPQNRIREVQTSPSGAAFGAAQAGVDALARGVKDMGAAISAKGEQIRVTERQKTEVEYRTKAQGIMDEATKSGGANAPEAVAKAREDLAKLKRDTLANSWGSSARELENSTSISNLQSEAMLLSHVNQQQKVAVEQIAELKLKQSEEAVGRADVDGMLGVAESEAEANLSAAKENYFALTGYEMPEVQQQLLSKSYFGKLTFDGFVQKFAENPFTAMGVWDADKEKLKGRMDAANYAALEAKTQTHRKQVAFILADGVARRKFTDDAGVFDPMGAAKYAMNPQNWEEDSPLDSADRLRLASNFSSQATMERQQYVIKRGQTQEAYMKILGEMASSGKTAALDTMLNDPGVRNTLTFSQLQALDGLNRAGKWTGEMDNNLTFDIYSGGVTTQEQVMRRVNGEADYGTYARLLDSLGAGGDSGGNSVYKAEGNPNYISSINSRLTDHIKALGLDTQEATHTYNVNLVSVRSAVLANMRMEGVTDPHDPRMMEIIERSIGKLAKISPDTGKVWGKNEWDFPTGETRPDDRTSTGVRDTRERVEEYNKKNDLSTELTNLQKSSLSDADKVTQGAKLLGVSEEEFTKRVAAQTDAPVGTPASTPAAVQVEDDDDDED